MRPSAMKMIALVALAACAQSAWAAGASCEELMKMSLSHTDITEAKVVAKGMFSPPRAPGGQAPTGQAQNAALYQKLPAFCRVRATVRPSADSDIKVEVWLPEDGWKGRLEAVG